MQITTVKYAERVVTTQYAYKELEMVANIQDGDNATECSRMLEGLVKSQLGLTTGDINVNTTTTEKKAPAKAVAIIEKVAGVKTLADVPEAKYAEIIEMAKKVVA